MKLYGYFRSSAAYRVRIALNLKGLAPEQAFVHLGPDRLEQLKPAYRAVNPQAKVPALELDDGTVLPQSLAIIEYLDEIVPQPPLLPADPVARAQVRAVALMVACEIHPLNNTAPLRWLRETLGADEAQIAAWYAHWVAEGFRAIEEMIAPAPYALGDVPTLADICLVPQVYNARRFKVPIDAFPKILAVEATCLAHPAFAAAVPEAQPDAPR